MYEVEIHVGMLPILDTAFNVTNTKPGLFLELVQFFIDDSMNVLDRARVTFHFQPRGALHISLEWLIVRNVEMKPRHISLE